MKPPAPSPFDSGPGTTSVLLICLFLVATGAAAGTVRPDSPWAAGDAGHVLETELALAKGSRLYYVLDIPGRRLLLKARGVVMKTIPFVSIGQTGSIDADAGTEPLTLNARGTGKAMRGRTASGVSEKQPGPITLTDMPDRYRLIFGPATELYVFPVAETFTDHIANALEGIDLFRRVNCINIRRLYGLAGGASPPRFIAAFLHPRDAQSLFWAVREGDSLLIPPIRPPSSASPPKGVAARL